MKKKSLNNLKQALKTPWSQRTKKQRARIGTFLNKKKNLNKKSILSELKNKTRKETNKNDI